MINEQAILNHMVEACPRSIINVSIRKADVIYVLTWYFVDDEHLKKFVLALSFEAVKLASLDQIKQTIDKIMTQYLHKANII